MNRSGSLDSLYGVCTQMHACYSFAGFREPDKDVWTEKMVVQCMRYNYKEVHKEWKKVKRDIFEIMNRRETEITVGITEEEMKEGKIKGEGLEERVNEGIAKEKAVTIYNAIRERLKKYKRRKGKSAPQMIIKIKRNASPSIAETDDDDDNANKFAQTEPRITEVVEE